MEVEDEYKLLQKLFFKKFGCELPERKSDDVDIGRKRDRDKGGKREMPRPQQLPSQASMQHPLQRLGLFKELSCLLLMVSSRERKSR